jgi:hypothetical protein
VVDYLSCEKISLVCNFVSSAKLIHGLFLLFLSFSTWSLRVLA